VAIIKLMVMVVVVIAVVIVALIVIVALLIAAVLVAVAVLVLVLVAAMGLPLAAVLAAIRTLPMPVTLVIVHLREPRGAVCLSIGPQLARHRLRSFRRRLGHIIQRLLRFEVLDTEVGGVLSHALYLVLGCDHLALEFHNPTAVLREVRLR
jgi:hypothetical protein